MLFPLFTLEACYRGNPHNPEIIQRGKFKENQHNPAITLSGKCRENTYNPAITQHGKFKENPYILAITQRGKSMEKPHIPAIIQHGKCTKTNVYLCIPCNLCTVNVRKMQRQRAFSVHFPDTENAR